MTRTLAITLAAALLGAGCTFIVDPTEYEPKHAGDCPIGQKPCGYKCVRADDPATGCANSSCSPCPAGLNGVGACSVDGSCGLACKAGFADCDLVFATGCEMLVTDVFNCGTCGRSCTGSCEAPAYTCSLIQTVGAMGPTTGLATDPMNELVYALVQSNGGQFARIAPLSPGLESLVTGLGSVSGLSVESDQAWFGSSNGSQSQVWYYATLTPTPAFLALLDSKSEAGPPVDLVHASAGTLWIPDLFSTLRFTPDVPSSPTDVMPTSQYTAIAAAWTFGWYFAAEASGTIWVFDDPISMVPTELVAGAGHVGSMATWTGDGTMTLYWADLATGDIRRAAGATVSTIFRGAGPTPAMDVAVGWDGSVYWTNQATGEVRRYGSYGGFASVVSLVGQSPAPGRITVTTSRVLWADDSDFGIRVADR